ncbi:ABC transporter substrate-binding protein [Pseudobutyrivibrio sp.]|uniref:ABC transporter substrate-binding protein n=1 Tax=Pseudobutyrivibrio sp. TaxID=2014367 RepID=UPI001D8FD10B|nr:ABC transporter substrate binding protein [Pseudobutyrivibrio sp.]MBE5909956.1 hypothetical protein [Pseudobutyrivibrio sp.]
MKKKIVSVLLIAALIVGLVAFRNRTSSEPEKESEVESVDDSYVYNIAACLSDDNEYNQILLQGFTDCLSDYLGESHISITTYTPAEEVTTDQLVNTALSKSPDMIFTAGKSALTSATEATDTTPIVATGIVDFKGTLRITSLNGKSWDKTTGINVTGVSSKPPIVDQVSLMIEATPDLQTVGILFTPEDTDSIYQNEIFEGYLDQAGIPWKEYIIPASENDTVVQEEQASTALTPSKYTAYSAKTGIDDIVEALEEDTVVGLNAPSSTRVAETSEFWTGGKIVTSHSDDETDENTEEETTTEATSKTEETEEETLESLIQEVCDECSVIYIPFGSSITDQMETISSIATESDVVIVGGDNTIAENSLVTLFTDPYSLGYSAGKKAVKVFDGEDISTIKITYGDSDEAVKLYNGEIAEELGIEFPKSFHELHEYLSTYEYGSNTTRYIYSGE